jgi:YbgC/YbaW family acyl-CoA thioester hydrolase
MTEPKEKFEPPVGRVVTDYMFMVRETHLDTFGHVNNATYLVLFEEARWDVVTARGFGLKYVMENGIGPTLLEVKLRYRRELRNRERVTIRTWVESHNGKITVLRQVMVNANGDTACVADFTIGLFDLTKRRLIEATPEWKYALSIS